MEPVRDIRFFTYLGDYAQYAPLNHEHCNQTIFTGPDGRAAQVSPGTTIDYKVYDLYDRPWAKIWEEYFEQDMNRPEEDDSHWADFANQTGIEGTKKTRIKMRVFSGLE